MCDLMSIFFGRVEVKSDCFSKYVLGSGNDLFRFFAGNVKEWPPRPVLNGFLPLKTKKT